MPWWTPHIHADRRAILSRRGHVKKRLRAWFEGEGFAEVECGALCVSPGNEAHLHAFATEWIGPSGERTPLYLHTSPEFTAKKLLAAGETCIFEFARVFRNRERTRLHAPEFTLLEWYRAGEDYRVVMEDALNVLRLAAEATGIAGFSFRKTACDPRGPARYLTVAEAFTYHAGVELLPTLSPDGKGDRDGFAARARRAGIKVAEDDGWSDIFSKILVSRVEPKLGLETPTILYRYPRVEAALARACPDDARLAERFELYACGVELANGFGELTDPAEQRVRFEAEMDEMERRYGTRLPIDEDFLAAVAKMPAASGAALGFDRLVMLATGARGVDDVIWTPAPLPSGL